MSSFQDAMARKRALIEAAKSRTKPDALSLPAKPVEKIKPEDAENKIRIIFDNSGSMRGQKIADAKLGCVEFLRNCTLNKDAVAIHLLNLPWAGQRYRNADGDWESNSSLSSLILNSDLTSDLVALASAIDAPAVTDTGSTPLFKTILNAFDATPRLNRMIAFSDGEPNFDDTKHEEEVFQKAKEFKIAIDTVFFGSERESGSCLLKRIAESTGGIFLVFDPAKGVSFAKAFKYLTPGKRLMLMDSSFKDAVEKGEVR